MRSSQIMNIWFVIRIIALLSAVSISLSALAQPVPPTVAAALRAAAITPGEYGVVALPLDGGPPLIAHNESLAFNPASTMKLVTTYAALSLLGAGYRWQTPILIRGRIDDGVLDGDLVLRGGGDPKLVIEDMVEMVSRLRALGLRVIRGNLVIDDSLYDIGDESTEKFDGDPSQPYNVRPHAAMMNFKATRVSVRPQTGGLAVDMDPPRIGRQLAYGNARLLCGDRQVARASAVSFVVESGHVYLPKADSAAWVNDAIYELSVFPNGKNDDIVDSLTQALTRLYGRSIAGAQMVAI
jgi:D-alanyl-D-alanine carboxypeptidase/D-alanyl-D-alanine-endopeptidase (penicillin-binding protein 4)